MCGIVGVVTPDRREAESAIRRMVPTMVHRGPDDGGYEVLPMGGAAVVALGFRRLAILDLSPAGHQPMRNPDSGDVLIFNGEIYNFAALRSELVSAGCRFRGTSDTEVLLHALGQWGDATFARLEGMYALAFHRAHDGSLLLARDPLGIKPLYVARHASRVIFASEIRTILASGMVRRDIDVAGVAGMLAYGAVQAPRTVFADIEEFPAGHAEWFGRPRHCFWTFPPVLEAFEGDPVAATKSLVHDAVRRHLVADVPVGVFLSAGIDSTVVAACAAEASSSLAAFTVGIGAQHPDDESAVATETARRLGIKHEIVNIDERDVPQYWHSWVDSLDSPSIDGFNTWLVTRSLARHGFKVGLSGLGADELFGGYPVYRRGPELRRLMAALSFLPHEALATAAAGCLLLTGKADTAEKLADVLRGPHDLRSIALGLRRLTSDHQLRTFGLPIPQDGRADDDPRFVSDTTPGDDFNTIARIEVARYMRNTLLRDSDANSMAHSLELRVPFLDQPLVDRVLALPGYVKASAGGTGKKLLRRAFHDRIPQVVARRRKTGFTLPVGSWMRGEMREFCEDAISALDGFAFLNGDAVRQSWLNYLGGARPLSWTQPLTLVVLGTFLRRHAAQDCHTS